MAQQLREVVECIDVVEFAGVDQPHEQVAHLRIATFAFWPCASRIELAARAVRIEAAVVRGAKQFGKTVHTQWARSFPRIEK